MATQQPPATDLDARREQVKRDLEAAIAQTVEEIRCLEALLAVRRRIEQIQRALAAGESEAGE